MISDKAKKISSQIHIEKSLFTGRKGEYNFEEICKKYEWECKKSTKKENIYSHIDFYLFNMGVDVKGLKESHKKNEIIVEFKNVQGHSGWCSKESKATLIAFEFLDFFVLVKKNELLEYCRKNVFNVYVKNFKDCYKKLYQRKNRKDLMTKLNIYDLKRLESYIELLK
jgi:hypothetical protein|tara:strand:+ start:488 stop:991 length:504 start_codon:yes stop_codon:yes gene_type:complete